MIAQSWLSRCWQWQIQGYITLVGTLCVGISDRVNAQILPDNTLGAEGSVITPNVNIRGIQGDRIDGGATRGANLFHSFQEFNVGQGRGVYFANPTGIENILTRVTGSNASNILGRLGVLGGANLFLLNPNGIVFGSNASLDIQGSFVATTAGRIQLGDTGYFSATQPQTSSLLSVSPGALFFNAVVNQPSSIINRGNLSTPKHLTLAGGNLDLQGQIKAGGDLTLQAQDMVRVRDSVTTPFLARSGGNLTIVGNQGIDIKALNHPTLTPFISGGNLSLISDGIISVDAHFSSGGSFSIQSLSGGLANFVSLYDPIISSNGDVDVAASYTGASLLVESKGNIRFGGDIFITGPDTSRLPAGPDTVTLSTSSALILRSGQSTLAYGGINAGTVPAYNTGAMPAGITLGGNVTLQPFNRAGGIVKLSATSGNVSTPGITTNGGTIEISSAEAIITNGYLDTRNGGSNGGAIALSAQNNITTGGLYSYSYGNGSGGAITLSAQNNITTGGLYSYSYGNGNGGAITLSAQNNITTGDLYSYSYGNGGAITLNSRGSITLKGTADTSSESGDGGAIALSAQNNITTGDLYSASNRNGNGGAITLRNGNGGAITLTAQNNITTGDLYSASNRDGNGGAITLTAQNDITTESLGSVSNGTGNAGAIALTAAHDIKINGDLFSYANPLSGGNAGQAGAIHLTAANDIITGSAYAYAYSFSVDGKAANGGTISLASAHGNISTGSLSSDSRSVSGSAGNGGAINIIATNGSISSTGYLVSSSTSAFGSGGNGGAITLEAANDIYVKSNVSSFSYSVSGTAGQGGAISLISTGGNISSERNQTTGSFSISEQGTAGNGGNVTLEAKNNVSNLEILTLSSDSQSGTVQIIGLGDLLLTNTNILTSKQVTVPFPFGGPITLNVGGKGQSGNVDVSSLGNLTFNNSSIQSDTKGSDQAGNVTVNSPGLITFNNSSIRSNTSSTGAAGSIGIEAGQGITLVGSDSKLFAGTTNSGKAGDITLTTPELTLQNQANIATTTESSSAAGNITLQFHPKVENLTINLEQDTSISASTSNQGTGGNIEIKAPNAITIQGQGTITTETTGDGAAGELRIETQRLTIADGATISASTSSQKPEGTGGSIIINATSSFNLNNRASLRAQSTGAAPGGNIKIHTDQLTANNGTIATSSEKSSGGDITIKAGDIHLFGNSDITTRVNSGTGKGGDITLTAGSIVAFDDSDILAYAPRGTGGNITLDTRAFFGQNYRPAPKGTDPDTLNGNDRVDVNATGAVEGVITRPDTTFIQNSLTELPDNQINTDRLLANSCIVRRNQPTRGSFFITGTGGLPQRPGDTQMSSFPTVDVETLPSDGTPSTTNPNRPWQKGDPIVEPQGVYRLPNGKLVMSRECSRIRSQHLPRASVQ